MDYIFVFDFLLVPIDFQHIQYVFFTRLDPITYTKCFKYLKGKFYIPTSTHSNFTPQVVCFKLEGPPSGGPQKAKGMLQVGVDPSCSNCFSPFGLPKRPKEVHSKLELLLPARKVFPFRLCPPITGSPTRKSARTCQARWPVGGVLRGSDAAPRTAATRNPQKDVLR